MASLTIDASVLPAGHWVAADYGMAETGPGGFVVSSGRIQLDGSSTSAFVYAETGALPDQSVEAVFAYANNYADFPSFSAGIRLMVLYTNESNYAYLYCYENPAGNYRVALRTVVGGTNTEHGDFAADMSAADIDSGVRFLFAVAWESGNAAFSCARDGVQLGSPIVVSGLALTSGQPGFRQSSSSAGRNAAVSWFEVTGLAGGPEIGPISTDDTVTQGETGITFRISGFESAPTAVSFGGTSLAFTQELVVGGEGDIDVTLTDPIPLNLDEGSYNLVVSNADESATKAVGYVVTHPIELPAPGEYDSNSILAGLGTSFPAGSFANLPIVFVGEESITPTFKSGSSWADQDLTQSIDDILQAPEGVTGSFSATAEALFPDGSTDTWVIGLEVAEPIAPAIVVTLRDAADSSAVVNTGNIVVWVLSLAHPSTVLYSTDEAMTDEAGQLVIESDALVVDDVVQLVVSLSDGRTTCAQVTVEDIAA